MHMQIKDCIDSAKDAEKYFKKKTVVHGSLDKARDHVKVVPVISKSRTELLLYAVQSAAIISAGEMLWCHA